MYTYALSLELHGLPALLAGLLVLFVFFYVFIFVPLKIITSLVAHGKKKADRIIALQQTVIKAAYEPPAGFSAAEIGFLYDKKISIEETFASIIQLEQAGIVVLERKNGHLLLSHVDLAVPIAKQHLNELRKHIIPMQASNITMLKLKSLAWRQTVSVRNGLIEAGYFQTFWQQVKQSLVRIGIVHTLLLLLTLAIFRPNTLAAGLVFFSVTFILSPLYFLTSVLLVNKYTKIAGETWLGTPRLKQLWPEIEGYKLYIQLVEEDNLKFDTEHTKTVVKNKAHAYAIALGFNTGWRKQL